jgi:drug/metabolite transporter (DMT)-like permease
MTRRSLAIFELLTADLFWGFGFVAAIWAMQTIGPFALTSLRFLISFLISVVLSLFIPSLRRYWTALNWRLSVVPGVLIGLTMIFQTWGLQWTTATRGGFLTGLYVIFVPLIERVCFKKPLHRFHALFVILAIGGTALIVDFHGGEWNRGDVLMVLCSLCAAFQISWMGKISHEIDSPVVFNSMQCLWAGFLSAALACFFEVAPQMPQGFKPWFGLLSVAIGSTWLAFALQVRAQKAMSPALASLLFLLESPLALVFGFWLLDERIHLGQMAGAGLILLASALAIMTENKD